MMLLVPAHLSRLCHSSPALKVALMPHTPVQVCCVQQRTTNYCTCGQSHRLSWDTVPKRMPHMQILRSKGFVWLARRDDMMGEWSSAGQMLKLSCGGPWFAAIPQENWPDLEASKPLHQAVPQPPAGLLKAAWISLSYAEWC